MRRDTRTPRDHLVDGEWPHGHIEGPWAAHVVANVARTLELVLADRTLRSVADGAGVPASTLWALLHGHTWPQVTTIARLEEHLGTSLWPPRDR